MTHPARGDTIKEPAAMFNPCAFARGNSRLAAAPHAPDNGSAEEIWRFRK